MINKSKPRYTAVVAISTLILAGCFGSSAEQYLSAAKADLDKKDNVAAVIQLKNALQKNPSLAEARFLLGQALLDTGDSRGAEIELGKAHELGFADDRWAPAMAQTMLAQGQFEKVVTDFRDTKLSSPVAMADLQTSLATAYSATGKAPKAMEVIDAALAADGGNVRAQLMRIRLLAEQSGPAAALPILENLLAKDASRNSEAWQLKGDLLSLNGRPDDALVAFRQALSLDKGNVHAHVGIFSVLLAKKDLDGAKAQLDALRAVKAGAGQVQILTAQLALERNDLKTAHESVLTLLKMAPDDVRVLHLAGVVEYRRGALLEAENYLSKTVQASPGFAMARVLLAQTNLREGDPAKALTVLQPLLTGEGTNVEAYSIAAEAYLQAGDPKRAEEAFLKVAKLKPNDVPSRTALALVQISKGKTDEGIAALRSLSASDSNPLPDMALVTTFLQKKDWDQALKALDVLQTKTPDRPTPFNVRGRIELVRGNADKARSAFEAALKIDPVFFPAARSLAALDIADKHPDAALARFQKILASNPKNLPANMAIIGLRAQAGATKEELAESLTKLTESMPTEPAPRLALIELQLQRKQVKLALTAAQEAVAAVPQNPEAWKLLAQVQIISGDFNQAVSSYNKLIALQPKSPEPYMLLARAYAARGDTASAGQNLKRALGLKPGYQPAQLAMISTEISAGNFTEARRLGNSLKTLYPNDALVYSMLGDIDTVQKEWSGAAGSYRSALKLLPNVDVAIKLHRVLIAGGKSNEAKQMETEAFAHPQEPRFLIYLADWSLMQNNYEEAQQRYRAVLKLQPDNANAANNMAWLLNKMKDPAAVGYAEKANKLVPDRPDFLDTLAQIQADAGQFEKAVATQKRGLSLAPDIAVHRLHLAQFYIGAGQKAQAREELARLAALGDKFPRQPEVKKLMESL